MKKRFIYFMLLLLPVSYSCLDTPNMVQGIANRKEEPTVTTTDPAFNNEKFSLTIKGEILAYGKESDFFRQGFYWGTDSTNMVDSVFFKRNENVEVNTFYYELQNLNGMQTYYWRAVARNQYGIALGKIREYAIPSEEPSVVSGEISAFPADGALIFKGEVLSFGKINSFFEKGFCWGTDAENLTDSVFFGNDNFGLNTFSHTLQNVCGDAIYYWRAYARNDYGISLGEIRTYKTPPIFEIKDDFIGLSRSNFVVFTLKNILYLTCGDSNGSLQNDLWWYDGNRWRNDIQNSGASARRYPVAFTINDSLAYMGTGQGINGSQRLSFGDFYAFDGNTQKWTSVSTPSEMPRYQAVAFSLNNKGYVVGGNSENGELNDVWEYSINDNAGSWRKMKNFPKLFSGGISIYNKEKVFVGFGNSTDTENILWEYDAANDTWEEFAVSPAYPQGGHAKIRSGVIIRDKIYLIDVINTIWELDLSTKPCKYKQKGKIPANFPPLNEQYLFSVGDVIYIGLGGTKWFYRYYPSWDN